MSTEMWDGNMDLCRCCLAEGKYKNLADPSMYLGQNEIYSDMLKFCFDINLEPVPGKLSSSTYTICDACVSRLRDALHFKNQVQECQEKFMDMLHRHLAKLEGAELKVKEELAETYQDDEFGAAYSLDDYHEDEEFDDSMQFKQDTDEDSESPTKSKKTRETKVKTEIKTKKSIKTERPKKEEKDKAENEEDDAEMQKKKELFLTRKYYTLEEPEDDLPTYNCVTCGRTFSKQALVHQHYKHVHLRLRPKLISCYRCDIRVPAHSRTFHLEKAHGIPAPTCGACGKKFAYPHQVLRHQQEYHMGEKKFYCEFCEMRFTTRNLLKRHLMTHSDLKPYHCEYCEKSFKWKKNLKTHHMMHLDDRRQVCKFCGDAFVQRTSLKYHITKKHPEML